MKATKHFLSDSRLAKALPYVILAVVTFTAYAGTLRAKFVYDDHTQLVENVALRSLKNIPAFFTDPAHTSGSMIFEEIYRPLRATVFAIEYRLWGLNPTGFHAVNILFHLLNTILLFVFLRWLLQSKLPAFGAALLFAVHPALTEDVCWVCSSSDLLCMFFFLIGLLAFYRSREQIGKKRSFFHALALVSLLLSLLSKEMGVTFAAAVVAIDVWREGLEKQTPRRWLEYAPLWAVTLGYLAFRATVMTQFAQREAWGGTALATAGIMARGIKYYIRLLVFPFHLTIIPGINPMVPLSSAETILSAALVLGLLIFAILFRRRFPAATLGIILFFILLLPVSNIVPIKAVVGDRFIYIPSLGFFVLMGAVFRALEEFRLNSMRGRTALAAGAVIVPVFLFSVNTIVRSVDWRDGFSLYKAAVEVNPNHPRPREMLAKEYFLRSDFEAARENCLVALRVNPRSVDAHSLLGTIYLQQGLLKQAEQELKTALELEPKSGDARTNLGVVYKQQGKLDEALEQFEMARKNSPMVSEILNNIGSIFLKRGDSAASLGYLSKAVEIKPDNWEAACNLAYALISLRRYHEAVRVTNASLSIYPNEPELLALMGRAYSGSGNYQAAAEAFGRILLRNPADTQASLSLADMFMKIGQPLRAAEIYRRLLARYPDTLRLHLLLASSFEAAGEIEAALKELRIAAELAPDDATLRQRITVLSRRSAKPSSDRISN
jgi:tetratricopeptide (TPR) repeat protein